MVPFSAHKCGAGTSTSSPSLMKAARKEYMPTLASGDVSVIQCNVREGDPPPDVTNISVLGSSSRPPGNLKEGESDFDRA